jgi:hypothetical protein
MNDGPRVHLTEQFVQGCPYLSPNLQASMVTWQWPLLGQHYQRQFMPNGQIKSVDYCAWSDFLGSGALQLAGNAMNLRKQ